MGQSACGGCFAGLGQAEKGQAVAAAPEKAKTSAVPESAATQPAHAAEKSQAVEEAAVVAQEPEPNGDDVSSWQPGKGGVTDISPVPGSGRLLFREAPGAPEKAATPSDGAQVTFDIEAWELLGATREERLPRRRLTTAGGSGEARLPEELELAIPCLKQGAAVQVFCQQFGEFGPLPQEAPWSELANCAGKSVILKIELVEAQDLCLATLEGHERLDYAQGRKDAGSRYFKRARYEAALERYSLAAEMLGHIDDIKDSSLNIQAKELRGLCELNAAACLLKMEKWREAEAVCNSLLRQNPENEKARFRRAKALLSQGDGAQAQADLRKILEANPTNAEAKQLLQQARAEAKGTARERKVYAKMLG